MHVIDETSPLANWLQLGRMEADHESELVFVVEAYQLSSAANRMRQRVFSIPDSIKRGCTFSPMVKSPWQCA